MIRKNLKSNDGFTAIELVIVIAVLAAVAYLVLPLVFPSDSKAPEKYIEEDLNSISEILKVREQTSTVNDIPVEDIYIGNLGVFAAKSQVRHTITIDTNKQVLTYCLRGDYKGVTRYYESTTGIQTQPTGSIDCPGFEATNPPATEGENQTETGNETTTPTTEPTTQPTTPATTEPTSPAQPTDPAVAPEVQPEPGA